MYRRGAVKITVRRGAERSARSAVPLVAVGCGLVLALGGCSGSSGTAAAAAVRSPAGSAYTLMQMNLCLSGVADCYRKVQYPAVLNEAIARIRDAGPDAVTFNEACSGDVASIARRAGYHLAFRDGDLLRQAPAVHPATGRPRAVRRRGARQIGFDRERRQPALSRRRPAPSGAEWLCVEHPSPASTRAPPTLHRTRARRGGRERARSAASSGRCSRGSRGGPPGHLRRRREPSLRVRARTASGSRTDGSARQDPGSQQVYGSGALRSPSARVVPAIHTDHDVLLVRAYLSAH